MLKVGKKKFPAIQMIPGQILTERKDIILPGDKVFTPNGEIDKIAVFERHKATGKAGVGAVLGFGLRNGAIASSRKRIARKND